MKDTSSPAFARPASDAHVHGMHDPQSGMSLRDYFAAKALVGELACQPSTGEWATAAALAQRTYEIADAMLKTREM